MRLLPVILVGAILLAGTAPVVPSQLKFMYAAQGSIATLNSKVTIDTSVASDTPSSITKTVGELAGLPDFTDDGSGTFSYAVFQDDAGNPVYVQIPNGRYTQMGQKDGVKQNPTKEEFVSIFQSLGAQPAKADFIIFDASSTAKDNSGTVTSLTWAHTTSGASRGLAVIGTFFRGDITVLASSTYNNIPLTLVTSSTTFSIPSLGNSNWQGWAFFMVNPALGANNIVVNFSNTSSTTNNKQIAFNAMSLDNVRQNGNPESFGITSTSTYLYGNVGATSTVQGPNSWLLGVADDDGGGIGASGAGAGTVFRSAVQFNQYGADSNGGRSPGSQSLVWNRVPGAANNGSILAFVLSIAPNPVGLWWWNDF